MREGSLMYFWCEVRVTKEQNDDCKKLLRLMGMPVVEASKRGEGDRESGARRESGRGQCL